MTEKEISKLTRKELIQMLISVSEENDRLKEKNEQLEKDMKVRKIAIEKSGSMAEAALKLNRVFEAADAAAKQYLQNVKAKADAQAKAQETSPAEVTEEAKTTELAEIPGPAEIKKD